MPVQFMPPLAERISTVSLERQLLNILLSDQLGLQRLVGRHRPEFFTSQSRVFIHDCVDRAFSDRKSRLTEAQLKFEIEKRYDSGKDKARIDDIMAEYRLILGTARTDSAESIIANLEQVQLARRTEEVLRKTYELQSEGRFDEAAQYMRRESVSIGASSREGRILNLHKDSDDWFDEVRRRHDHPELYAGVPTGFEKFDEMTGGLFPAELTIVYGLSGKGKSTFMKAMSCNIRKQGRIVLHCGNEENEFQMRSKYMSADSGERYSPFKRGTYTDEEYGRLKLFSDGARGVGAIYIYEFPQQTDASWIERAFRTLEMQGVRPDVIVVDYLDLMKPVERAYSENDEGGKITSDLKQVAIDCNCPVVTATQAGTQSEKQEKKSRPFLTAADVFGTKRKVHSANTLIGIVNQTATAMAAELSPEERKRHKMVLCVPKNRDGAVFTFRQVMDVECGRFYEDTDEDDPVMQSIERQAMQMIDESLPPDKMRSEIDVKEILRAKQESLNAEIDRLNQVAEKMDGESADDPFLSDGPEEPDVPDRMPEDRDEGEEGDGDYGEMDDPFLSEAPDASFEEMTGSRGEPDGEDGVPAMDENINSPDENIDAPKRADENIKPDSGEDEPRDCVSWGGTKFFGNSKDGPEPSGKAGGPSDSASPEPPRKKSLAEILAARRRQ